MKKKFQYGQTAPEYVVVAAVLALVFVVGSSSTDPNGEYKGFLELATGMLSDLWTGFSYVVSLPLS